MARTLRTSAVLLVALTPSVMRVQAARSESLCDGLKKALATAQEKFVPLRGKFDFTFNQYEANISFGPATDCSIDSGDGVSELQCTQNFDNPQVAQAAFVNYLRNVRDCFGQGVTLKRSNIPTHQWFRHEETTNDIEVRLGELKERNGQAPRPYIQITVNYIDPTVR